MAPATRSQYLLPTSRICANPSCIKTTARSALAVGSECNLHWSMHDLILQAYQHKILINKSYLVSYVWKIIRLIAYQRLVEVHLMPMNPIRPDTIYQ